MTNREALVAVQRRWGDAAIARCRPPRTTAAGKTVPTHMVGLERGNTLTVKGRGMSWEEALEQADRTM